MELYGNQTTFNFEVVLRENIVSHEYMRRTARSLTTWGEVIDEIYGHVEHVEPWMTGNVRGPSTAFCLLYRLMELKLTEQQLQDTVACKDSPYIRALGFLYLRYVGDPKELWTWCEPYINDQEKFWPSGEGFGKEVTMGEFVRDLLLCQLYFQTIFTRIPKKVGDMIVERLSELGLPTQPKGNGGQGGPDRRGGDEGRARPASVKASLSVSMATRPAARGVLREDPPERPPKRDGHERPPPRRLADGAERDRHNGGAERGRRDDWRERDRGREDERGAPPERPRDWDRDRGGRQGRDERDRDYDRDDRRGRGGGGRDGGWRRGGDDRWDRHGGADARDRDRGRSDAPPASAVFGRTAAAVFGKSAAGAPVTDSLRASYGDERPLGSAYGAGLDKSEEVFRIGGRR